eukprot:768103-Hanusia_phi.AAC.4
MSISNADPVCTSFQIIPSILPPWRSFRYHEKTYQARAQTTRAAALGGPSTYLPELNTGPRGLDDGDVRETANALTREVEVFGGDAREKRTTSRDKEDLGSCNETEFTSPASWVFQGEPRLAQVLYAESNTTSAQPILIDEPMPHMHRSAFNLHEAKHSLR